MTTDATFGEISFLRGTATATVIANDDIDIYVIEAEYLKRLFHKNDRLAARFFKYLAIVLERRLRSSLDCP